MRSKSLSRCATLLFASFFAVLIFLAGSGAQAQVASKADRASAESLTQSLIALHTQYRATPAEGRAALIGQLRALAAERQQFLNSLIQTSPAEVLRVAIPNEVSAHMPGSVRGYLEQETDTEGELQVTYEDAKNSATLHHYVKTGGQRLELKFAANAPKNLLTGARVHVHGTRIGSALALSSGTSTSSFQVVQAAPLANTFGAQSTLVMLVNFQDNPVQPYTVASVQDAVFNQTSGFWMENSFQQTWLTGDVAGWYTLSLSSTSCNVDTIASYAEQAAQNSGYALSNYNHFLIAFPSTTACVWWGYSYIGGTPSTSWVNGVVQIKVVSHELGHALGLYHSHSLDCGTVVYAASGCTLNEYGDSFDTMGNSSPMDYDASQKERLGWLNYSAQPPITTVTASGTYTLSPYEAQDSNPKALKILQSGTTGSYYYLESRQATGYDASYDYYVKNGVLLHIAAASDANSSDLLNTTPGGPWYAPALAVGQSFTDAAAGVTITPTAVSSTGATVQVTIAGATCTHANPSLSLSPGQSPWVVSGTPVSFTATLTNNDSSACSSSSFNLAAVTAVGWGYSFGSSVLTLAPGASASTTMQVTSPAGTADGFYNVSATAASATYSGSASATYGISTPPTLTMSVSTDKSSYSANQTVIITVTVLSGSSADAGASVSGTITPPKGGPLSFTGTTGSNGTVVFSYLLKRKATSGTYQVQANTTATGASTTKGASTTFTVQ